MVCFNFTRSILEYIVSFIILWKNTLACQLNPNIIWKNVKIPGTYRHGFEKNCAASMNLTYFVWTNQEIYKKESEQKKQKINK